ncbi:methyltransferase type 11 [Rhypophila sp. PSN 637]
MALPDESENSPTSPRDQSQLQYDKIGSSYSQVKQLPTSQVEIFNLHAAIAPCLASRNGTARVLDLACGTGHYSRNLVSSWGAASVVGVDISPAMVKSAKDITSTKLGSQCQSLSESESLGHKIQFMVGDAISMGKLDDRGFDLAVGAWLLNYSRTEDELVKMFGTICSNLSTEDGIFAGIAPPPVPKDHLAAAAEYVNKVVCPKTSQPPWRFSVRYIEPLNNDDGGWKIEFMMFGDEGKETVKFVTYHLPMEAYERAARKGGMYGQLVWRDVTRTVAVDGDDEDAKLWDRYFEDIGGHFRGLVVGKGAANL